jgi:hypothetical protein
MAVTIAAASARPAGPESSAPSTQHKTYYHALHQDHTSDSVVRSAHSSQDAYLACALKDIDRERSCQAKAAYDCQEHCHDDQYNENDVEDIREITEDSIMGRALAARNPGVFEPSL